MNGLCKIGETKVAIQLLRIIEAQSIEPDVVMYNTIIHSLIKHKLPSQACDMYSEMVVKGISPDIISYNTLIYGYCIRY